MFATRNIACGSPILKEEPLFVIRKPHEMITEEDILAAWQQLPLLERQQFLCLRDNGTSRFMNMGSAMAENCFAVQDRKGVHARVYGLFLLQSRFNHSCVPNAKVPDFPGEVITSFAIRDITAGEEIFLCYNPNFECWTREDRHRMLRFACNCKACLVGTPFQQLSEMRRTLIRGLKYLISGEDVDGQLQGPQSPIIMDPKLKQAAETFNIPLSARLVYNLLIMVLLQEEGLLDEFTVGRMSPPILCLPAKFATQSNAEVAKLALSQGTWLQKFCVSLRLWGKRDAADDIMPYLFREAALRR